jgi:hypothetical protein
MRNVLTYASVSFCLALAACSSNGNETVGNTQSSKLDGFGAPITRGEAVERARGWANARVPYCGATPGGYDILCYRTCNRGPAGSPTRNADWDRYRSDCSGLVSYAWGLAPPGLTTYTLPNVSSRIDLGDIDAADAFVNDVHTMLFVEWAAPGVARFIEEPDCGLTARLAQAAVSRSGNRVYVAGYGTFDVRRYAQIRDEAPIPYEEGPRPEGGPFEALEVRTPVMPDLWVTQCNGSADAERVWQTLPSGPSPDARWAAARWPQGVTGSCGDAREGVHPLVFKSLGEGQLGAWVVQCTGQDGQAAVFHATGESVDGHPAAAFSHYEGVAGCP